MKPASAEKKEKIFWKGGKCFSLFPEPLKGMEIKCAETGESFNNIPIHLSTAAISKSPVYLGIYSGVSLAVHGIQSGVTTVTRDTIIAFGMEGAPESSMAAKITCFRNFTKLIESINNHMSGFNPGDLGSK